MSKVAGPAAKWRLMTRLLGLPRPGRGVSSRPDDGGRLGVTHAAPGRPFCPPLRGRAIHRRHRCTLSPGPTGCYAGGTPVEVGMMPATPGHRGNPMATHDPEGPRPSEAWRRWPEEM